VLLIARQRSRYAASIFAIPDPFLSLKALTAPTLKQDAIECSLIV